MTQKVIVIAGPTGVGKTALSIKLAKQFGGEIINGDAMQVYQELTIGTAKITPQEMDSIPHHLIDFISYQDEYNVKVFQEKARKLLEQLHEQHTLAIVCGGTGLYIKSLLYDYEFKEQKKDQDFLKFLSELSNEQLYALLQHVDINACATIHPNNRQRIVRALEMAHLGEKKSELIERQEHKLLYDAFVIGLTMDRETLYRRIDDRVDQMMSQGLFEEVEDLVKNDPHIWKRQSFQSIGYKEWKDYFQQAATKDSCVAMIKKNSRNFAKRQYTWFRNQMDVNWYDVSNSNWEEILQADLETWLKKK